MITSWAGKDTVSIPSIKINHPKNDINGLHHSENKKQAMIAMQVQWVFEKQI